MRSSRSNVSSTYHFLFFHSRTQAYSSSYLFCSFSPAHRHTLSVHLFLLASACFYCWCAAASAGATWIVTRFRYASLLVEWHQTLTIATLQLCSYHGNTLLPVTRISFSDFSFMCVCVCVSVPKIKLTMHTYYLSYFHNFCSSFFKPISFGLRKRHRYTHVQMNKNSQNSHYDFRLLAACQKAPKAFLVWSLHRLYF